MPSEGFASAGLVALVVRALQAERPELLPEGTTAPDAMRSALTGASDKRGLLETIMEKAGAGPLLAIGQFLDRAEATPTLQTLIASPEPAVLAEKWMRLERYHHASNRTRISLSDKVFTCVRYGEAGAPVPAENVVIAGFLFGLCQRAGARNAVLEIEGQRFEAGDLHMHADMRIETAERFAIAWQDWPAARHVEQNDHDASPIERLNALLASDIGRGWRLAEAAPTLALSVRSLQRHLSGEGRSFSSVLRQARVSAAGALLSGSEAGLAEIGYCCGYADQAHFQRDFRRALNLTPLAFRQIAQSGRF